MACDIKKECSATFLIHLKEAHRKDYFTSRICNQTGQNLNAKFELHGYQQEANDFIHYRPTNSNHYFLIIFPKVLHIVSL